MQSLFDNPALKIYALSSAVVALHLFILAFMTAGRRAGLKAFVNPEDATLNKGTQVEVDHADVQRVKRAHQNALENAVPFFAVGLLYALTNPSPGMAQGLFYTYVGSRVLHSVSYLAGKQPFRTLMFVVGAIATIVMAVQVIRAVV